jgi:hypothetical protein
LIVDEIVLAKVAADGDTEKLRRLLNDEDPAFSTRHSRFDTPIAGCAEWPAGDDTSGTWFLYIGTDGYQRTALHFTSAGGHAEQQTSFSHTGGYISR